MLMEQLSCMYFNSRLKSAPKGIIIVCFHLNNIIPNMQKKFKPLQKKF